LGVDVEKVNRASVVDVSYDADGVLCLVEVYQTGNVRLLKKATAEAQVNGLALLLPHFLRCGAAVPSHLGRHFHA